MSKESISAYECKGFVENGGDAMWVLRSIQVDTFFTEDGPCVQVNLFGDLKEKDGSTTDLHCEVNFPSTPFDANHIAELVRRKGYGLSLTEGLMADESVEEYFSAITRIINTVDEV